MTARAGSALWLLKHEVRMLYFSAGFGSKKGVAVRGMSKTSIAVWVAMTAGLHALAFFLMRKLPEGSAQVPHVLIMVVTFAVAMLGTLMLAQGLKASVEVLFERGDMDLLLSSPLSSRSIFIVRLAGIMVGVASVFLFFLAPFAHAGVVLGHFRWLAIYPVVLSAAAIAASLSMLVTLGLVRLLGVRRTRVAAQILGALSGALIFLGSQVFSHSSQGFKTSVATWFAPLMTPGAALGPDSLVWLPGRAVTGQPGAVLALCLVAVAMFALTVRLTHRFFVHGIQQAVSMVRVAAAPVGGQRYHFGRSLSHVIILKEWRMIGRDPQLISQVLLQLLYMMPMFFILFFKGGGGTQLPGLGAGLTFLCGSLTASLAWIVISAEDAPDLLRAAPSGMRTIRRAKLAAVTSPALMLVAAPLAWLLLHDPRAGALIMATVLASVTWAATIAMWCSRPAARGDFKTRAKGNALSSTLEILSGFVWAGIAFMWLVGWKAETSQWMLIGLCGLFAAAFGILLFGWISRTRDD